MKKLLLIVVDALSPRVLIPAMDDGKLPTLKLLADSGELVPNCTTIFPSITHAALASIATGSYPNRSGIPGSHWFQRDTNTVVHYTDTLLAIFNRGVGDFFYDMMVQMNSERLRQETIFEVVERNGLRAACINHLIHRSFREHKVNLPLITNLVPGSSKINTVRGPSMLYIGDFVQTPLLSTQEKLPAAGAMRRYGLDDQYSGETLLHLAKNRELPDFTLVYFMDNDYESHRIGPENALEVLKHIDQTLAKLCEMYGSVEQLLDEFCIVLTGDHAQSDMADTEADAAVDLQALLDGFSIAPIAQGWEDEHDIIVCPNMRTLQVYVKDKTSTTVSQLVDQLLAEQKVDQVMWSASLTEPNQHGYKVCTQEHGELHFWSVDSRSRRNDDLICAPDIYGTLWQWSGDLAVVDGAINADGVLEYADYPNAFERIASALEADNGGDVWATTKLGVEFQYQGSKVHTGGGSHASLHRLDSHVPLLLTGAPKGVSLGSAPRSIDIMPLCQSILGLD